MRHLLDLNPKIVIITYEDRYVFPEGKEREYKDLAWENRRDESYDLKLQALGAVEGDVIANIQIVEITTSEPVNLEKMQVTFTLTGYELNRINEAIAAIRLTYQGRKISLFDSVSLEY